LLCYSLTLKTNSKIIKWGDQMTQKKVIVVGAGGAGLTAAIEASMAGADVTVITKTSGGFGNVHCLWGRFFYASGRRNEQGRTFHKDFRGWKGNK
jgi:Succinate dehydrogenase/fumarate reductase, flavoprotein subunit